MSTPAAARATSRPALVSLRRRPSAWASVIPTRCSAARIALLTAGCSKPSSLPIWLWVKPWSNRTRICRSLGLRSIKWPRLWLASSVPSRRHTPLRSVLRYDQNKQTDPAWAPIFEAYAPVQRWLLDQKPDVVFYIFNDHVTSFFFDHYSAFALGIGTEYPPADEGGGPRALPPLQGSSEARRHIGHALMADEFDLSFFQDKPLDHGAFSPMSVHVAARAGLARADRAAASRRRAVPDSLGQALLQDRPSAAARDRELPRRPARRDHRDRRPLAPGARRARRLQQRRLGSAVPRIAGKGSGDAQRDDARATGANWAVSRAPRSSCTS